MLELLLFLTDTETALPDDEECYLDRESVQLIKSIHDLIVTDISKHYTIEELSESFGISATALKKKFVSIYGTSVYAYLKVYRLQEAQKQLLRTDRSIAEIAGDVGYENSAKFSAAFKTEYRMLPALFRKYVRSRVENEDP